MKKALYVVVAFLLCIAATAYFRARHRASTESQSLLVASANASPAAANPACQLPTHAPDRKKPKALEETAWRIFVAVNCKANNGGLVWETWTEQYKIFTAPGEKGTSQRFHGSPLALMVAQQRGDSMPLTPLTADCPRLKKVPKNLPNSKEYPADYCEEVHLNPSAQDYVLRNHYDTRTGQQRAVTSHGTFDFPTSAVEVKADWIPASDFGPAGKAPFKCDGSAQDVYVEKIDGKCYALAAMHISSKLLPKWVWATFEPQNTETNPWRCSTNLYGPCKDEFGSKPAQSSGERTELTHEAANLMKEAKLPTELLNYRMDGAQSAEGLATPTQLGNSFIEGETVGVKSGHASCITCHFSSVINRSGIEYLGGLNRIGIPPALPAGYISRDFAWALGTACPNSVFNSNPNCPAKGNVANPSTKQ